MANFTIETEQANDIFIIRSNGYLDEDGGAVIFKAVQDLLAKGMKSLIINFKDSPVINSQGIAQIIELSEMIVDEREGDLAFVGLSDLSLEVFNMVGLFQMAERFDTEEDAIADFS